MRVAPPVHDWPPLRCTRCSAEAPLDTPAYRCLQCGAPWTWDFPSPSFPGGRIATRAPNLWRYAEALPPFARPVTLGEPVTPLLELDIPHRAGGRLLAKIEGLQATGSYKDRGSAILISLLSALGVRRAVEDSSGNAAASLAAYAARAGMTLTVFCPASASRAKLLQVLLAGQPLRQVEGPRTNATEALLAHAAQTGERYASHLWHPFFIEGLKTLAFEIVEQLGWRPPDAVVAPCGAGSILLGLHRGFRELRSARVVDTLPRLMAVQAEAVAPVATAWRAGQRNGVVAPFNAPRPSLAEGILLPAPVRGPELLAALDESDGWVTAVSEEEIAEGVHALAARGLAVEPTSAVVWPALAHLREQEILRDGDLIVVVLSAHGLKAPAALESILQSVPAQRTE